MTVDRWMGEEEARVLFLLPICLGGISGYISSMTPTPTDRPDMVQTSDHLVLGSW